MGEEGKQRKKVRERKEKGWLRERYGEGKEDEEKRKGGE